MTKPIKRDEAKSTQTMYCYSRYAPSFYRTVCKVDGTVHQQGEQFLTNIGLWNLAWIANPVVFDSCETPAAPVQNDFTWQPESIREVQGLGLTCVDGRLLRDLAGENKARDLMKLVLAAKVIRPACTNTFWNKWLVFAKSRVKASADVPCGIEMLAKYVRPTQADALNRPVVFAIRLPNESIDVKLLAKALSPAATIH
ncbi:MAG: hypothetical protein ING69_01350 [Rhodocyclaceae bacterium]|nr:hypothetical protein [Rhodocyclaceae bacterium]MCA3081281.1 hypothetical protein [Rhodocyclaceae bacterium]